MRRTPKASAYRNVLAGYRRLPFQALADDDPLRARFDELHPNCPHEIVQLSWGVVCRRCGCSA